MSVGGTRVHVVRVSVGRTESQVVHVLGGKTGMHVVGVNVWVGMAKMGCHMVVTGQWVFVWVGV